MEDRARNLLKVIKPLENREFEIPFNKGRWVQMLYRIRLTNEPHDVHALQHVFSHQGSLNVRNDKYSHTSQNSKEIIADFEKGLTEATKSEDSLGSLLNCLLDFAGMNRECRILEVVVR
uniref:Uncharacterized protein n=1 Tax=Lactuca sativa TaxID=4236 RepID=A0A9R1XSN6_LACSA|nr:hypothetical protein LSAT_V11C100025840 [Lactuca sativa]